MNDPFFCPKCGREQAVAAECRCGVVFPKYLQRLGSAPTSERVLIYCVSCGEAHGDLERCAVCGAVPHEHYNRLAALTGLPLALVSGKREPAPVATSEPKGGGRLVRWLLAGGVALGAFALLLFVFLLFLIKGSEAYAEAETFLFEHDEVQRRLGPTVTGDTFPTGQIQTTGGGGGEAALEIDLEGQGGEGTAVVRLVREGGEWRIVTAHLHDARTDETLDLLAASPAAPVAEPARVPGGRGDALELLRAAVADHPDDFQAHRRLDHALASERRFDEVVTMWDGYLWLHPEDGRAYLERGGARYHLGQKDLAAVDAQRACDLGIAEGCQRAAQVR